MIKYIYNTELKTIDYYLLEKIIFIICIRKYAKEPYV